MGGSLACHLRPLIKHLDYNWRGLQESAVAARKCVRCPECCGFLATPARHLSELSTFELMADPLSILDNESCAWVEPMLATLGRRILIRDFESSTLPD